MENRLNLFERALLQEILKGNSAAKISEKYGVPRNYIIKETRDLLERILEGRSAYDSGRQN